MLFSLRYSLNSEGRTDLVIELYRELYECEQIQHWESRETLVMDLHGYDRGMAYAALYCALKEVRLYLGHMSCRPSFV